MKSFIVEVYLCKGKVGIYVGLWGLGSSLLGTAIKMFEMKFCKKDYAVR